MILAAFTYFRIQTSATATVLKPTLSYNVLPAILRFLGGSIRCYFANFCTGLHNFKYQWLKIVGIRDKKMGVKLGFITPTVMQVFEFFLEDNTKEYHEREVVRRTGVSKGSASKILKLLTNFGFLTREERGRLAIYRLNQKEPMVKQFKILINTFALKQLTDELKPVSRRIVLFGSCSQGTDTKESDIDMLVVTNEKDQAGEIISQFNKNSERRLAPITVDINEFIRLKREDKPLYENIERGITLWEAE